ncbi:HECT-like ubiquitin-conjugating enzyme-binding-domain-containing protein [Dichomitus squalens]|uniref:HECT-like ubiquitin-conjugating enzyme-binding-domain-containing protein n=1 Tax=Dichomitus squalens TaxID=114155 RepID=A0A4Q9MKK1_9APHY|nr:HECT-like ubiquitin-conjugating enzyme-binding-domain-containing protein [Dichomitus squalens]
MPSPRSPHTATSPLALFASIAAASSSSTSPSAATFSPSSSSPTPLQTLVLNLRAQEQGAGPSENVDTVMVERVPTADLADEPALVRELQQRVGRLALTRSTLSAHDAALARALVSLVAQFSRLAALHAPSSHAGAKSPTALPRTMSWGNTPAESASASTSASASGGDPLARLQRQITDLQLVRGSEDGGGSEPKPAVQAVETALLWTRVDQEFDRILELAVDPESGDAGLVYGEQDSDRDHLPPEYELGTYDPFASDAELPIYDAGDYDGAGADKEKGSPERSHHHRLREREREREREGGGMSEKMRMDLEAVALAIDRLYVVAPQLHDQRVELKKSKREQLEKMERARLASSSRLKELSQASASANGKGKDAEKQRVRPGKERAREELELERMVELIGRASERKLVDQAVVLDGGMEAKLERARQRDQEKREAFVTRLARHSDAGRLHSQEAVLAKKKFKDPDAMLTLPEFIREGVPQEVQLQMQINDARAMLSLPEFVREPVPEHIQPAAPPPTPISRRKSFRQLRSRSLSAPPLAWLLNQSPRSSSPNLPETPEGEKEKEPKKIKLRTKRPGSSSGIVAPPLPVQTGLDVHYVAEYHETLQHILVFLNVQGMTPGANLEAEVVPVSESSTGERSRLLLRCGASTSPLLTLPAPVPPGVKEVKVVGQYYEVKLPVVSPPTSPFDAPPAILDATQLLSTAPTSFVCAACSLPLVQASKLHEYRDLPSEHWAELVDAWMCHSDQRLHEHVKKHSVQGFWPQEGEALVGGSYILFEESAVVQNNVWPASEDDHKDDGWRRTRCICGAIIGRCQDRPSPDGHGPLVYRLAKYAVRPVNVNANASPAKLPLSAFIAEDMNEFVHAHATYRFVVFDEEEERPRLLIWLFKPSMRLSYAVPTQYVLAKSASVRAGKVLFRILDTAAAYSDLDGLLKRYPGFPQAEHLYYPRSICRRLAALLMESNKAYPENMRRMTGLDVGWLQRA